jgi:formamidopyrimidine-DNA glycosylase
MPEIPELEAMKATLNKRVAGRIVEAAEVHIPVVLRRPTKDEFIETLKGNRLLRTERRGKYLMLQFESGHVLAEHLMLTGRLQLARGATPMHKRTSWLLRFESGDELRYFDEKLDGKTYLLKEEERSLIPNYEQMGPDALDPALTFEVFRQRIKRFPGQVKRTLVNEAFIAGIGNAYADEILFEARIYPFAPTRGLSEHQLRALYEAIGRVYAWAIPIVAQRMGETIDEKIRDFLKIHRKGGQPCPNCGAPITEVAPNNRITSYCRACQAGGAAPALFPRSRSTG